MNMSRYTYEEIVAAADAAESVRLSVELYQGTRICVYDLNRKKIIKRFRPHECGLDVKCWIEKKFPNGAYIRTEKTSPYPFTLAFRRSAITPDVVARARAKVAGKAAA